MAEYVFKANTEKIREITDKITLQKAKMEGYMNDMKSKVSELRESFVSLAGSAYIEKYGEIASDINACLANLENEINALRNAAGIIDEKNQKAVNDMSNLSADNVFIN